MSDAQSMDGAPMFSIITATFNAGELLERTIGSLREQTCRNFEWIVMDGGSRDETVARIDAARDIVSKTVSEPDLGIADAWNKGLARAQGTHVLILNAGDTYDAGFLETIANHCNERQIICAHARLLSETGQAIGVFCAQPSKLARGMHLPHNWCAVPRRHYQELGPYRRMPLAMDFDWFHRYYRRYGASGFRIVDKVLGTYYLGGTSDVNYVASFRANERILVENGTSPIVARFYRTSYALKHALKRRLVRQGRP
jgi:glycosyltransferase involved in cell wall biosynthesis